MKNYLFHGSHVSGIETLHATSKLHGTEDTKVVYLTANPAYALFYIWDPAIYITFGIRRILPG